MSATALYTTAQSADIDAKAVADGQADDVLMRRAGEAVFAQLRLRWPAAQRVIIMVGPGNNGGDGLVVAELALAAAMQVQVLTLVDITRATPLSQRMAALLPKTAIALYDGQSFAEADVIVDALFGSGMQRPPADCCRHAIMAMNAAHAPTLAIDVPSGINADTGMLVGDVAVRADVTVCCITFKRGLFTGDALDYAGDVIQETLAVDPLHYAMPAATLVSIDDWYAARQRRLRNSHKGSAGHVTVVGGHHMPGAAMLAAAAALRTGAGLVRVATDQRHAPTVTVYMPELIVLPVIDRAMIRTQKAHATVIGPGLGHDDVAHTAMQAVIDVGSPRVFDADALMLLQPDVVNENDVLTPHPGEAARLLGWCINDVQHDRFAAAAALYAHFGACIVLKGAGTIVHGGDGVYVIAHGSAALATAGSGDVLAGIIAVLLAQGYSTCQAAVYGAVIHARAGEIAAVDGLHGMVASDLFAPVRLLVG